MSEKFLLVEHLSSLNDTIRQSLQHFQRIKFTCFDVSGKYIVFGATSGGIYVYGRSQCNFIRLIPNKEIMVVAVAVSPDEKHIAFATSKGLIILVQNCFQDVTLNYQQYTEHEGNLVTAMKWINNEVYCGDNMGKISVVAVINLLTMFQPPSASLMTLDSQIVQIDTYSKFLLVSTLTRTYLCNTEKETYKQIGKKLREGSYGACFLTKRETVECPENKATSVMSFFSSKETETDMEQLQNKVKIFCGRPGARIWQADFDASVSCTHQFKDTLRQNPADIIKLSTDVESHLGITSFTIETGATIFDRFHFGKLFALVHQFIFTFTADAFYIFHPATGCLLFWSNYYSHIFDVRIVKNFIYICSEDFTVHTLSIETLEDLLLQTLFRKQYVLCSELCIRYSDFVKSLIETSNRIHLLSILKTKLSELNNTELLDQIMPILSDIQEFSNAKKLKSGIVAINSEYLHSEDHLEEDGHSELNVPETFQVLKDIRSTVTDKLTESSKNIKEKLQLLETTVKNLTFDVGLESQTEASTSAHISLEHKLQESTDQSTSSRLVKDETDLEINMGPDDIESDANYLMNLLHKQYELTNINKNIEIQRLKEQLEAKDPQTVLNLFNMFLENSTASVDVRNWCCRQYLTYLNGINYTKVIQDLDIKEDLFVFIKDAFHTVNTSTLSCSCGYPLPSAKDNIAHFYDIGCEIYKKLFESSLLNLKNVQVPNMYRYVLCELQKEHNIDSLLPLIVQYSDEDVFKAFLHKFTYDIWDDTVRYLIKLINNTCLNCGKRIEAEGCITWTQLGIFMTESISGLSAVRLLKRHSKSIGELNSEFYQTCIFAAVADNTKQGSRKSAVNFMNEMLRNDQDAYKVSSVMSRFLNKKYLRSTSPNIEHDRGSSQTCHYCDLPINIVVLENRSKSLSCGHIYHEICLDHINQRCLMCK